MNPANEGLEIINTEVRNLSFVEIEEKNKIEDIEAALNQIKSIFGENMELKVEDDEIRENDTCVTNNGKIISLPKNTYKKAKINEKYREKGLPTETYYFVDSVEEFEKAKKDRKIKEVRIVDLANYIKAKQRDERNIG